MVSKLFGHFRYQMWDFSWFCVYAATLASASLVPVDVNQEYAVAYIVAQWLIALVGAGGVWTNTRWIVWMNTRP